MNLAVDDAVLDFNCPGLINVFINAAVDPKSAWTASFTDILLNLLGKMCRVLNLTLPLVKFDSWSMT